MNISEILNYRIIKEIGKGSFSHVYQAQSCDQQEYAIKVSELNTQQFRIEIEVLSSLQDKPGFPKVQEWFNTDDNSCIVMELLTENLYAIFKQRKAFKLSTIQEIGIQLLERLYHLHQQGYVHRDIKPQQIAFNPTSRQTLYLMDFGLAKRFKDNSIHYSQRRTNNPVGNPVFASLNTHRCISQSRRDDLEAMIYLLIYLTKGTLPWRNVRASTKVLKWQNIQKVKSQLSLQQICEGCPEQFQLMLAYVKGLSYEENPDYQYIFSCFTQIARESKCFPQLEWLDIPKSEPESIFTRTGMKKRAIIVRNDKRKQTVKAPMPSFQAQNLGTVQVIVPQQARQFEEEKPAKESCNIY